MKRTFEIWQAPFKQTATGYDAGAGYERVWKGEVPDAERYARAGQPVEEVSDLLEAIWTTFQRVDPETGPWPPEDFAGRSLSVGDVVVLDGWAAFAVEVGGFSVAQGWPERIPLRTATGRVLTDADVQALADEAELGYDVEHLKERP